MTATHPLASTLALEASPDPVLPPRARRPEGPFTERSGASHPLPTPSLMLGFRPLSRPSGPDGIDEGGACDASSWTLC
jgi:hypothetical protein